MRAASKHGVVIDIGYTSLKALAGGRGIEIPLARVAGGRLDPSCREGVVKGLREFLGTSGRQARSVPCAIPARGVSIRRLSLPPVPRDELESLVALQLETELPLPPEDLAWGFQVHAAGPGPAGADAGSPLVDVAVAALRREVLDDYDALFAGSGVSPAYTVGAVAAAAICPESPRSSPDSPRSRPGADGISALLDLGRAHSELLTLADSKPIAVRVISWGGDKVTAEIARSLGVPAEEAEALKLAAAAVPSGGFVFEGSPREEAAIEAIGDGVRSLGQLLAGAWAPGPEAGGAARPRRIHIVGGSSRLPGLAGSLSAALGGAVECRVVDLEPAPGRSAVTLGLELAQRDLGASPPLPLLPRAGRKEPPRTARVPRLQAWLAAVVILAATSLFLRYGAPIVRLGERQARLEEARALRASLPRLDRELGFLEFVGKSQVDYLEAMTALSRSLPQGTVLDGLTLNRQGEASIQGKAAGFEGANDLRARLVTTGWFSHVVLQEQAPSKEEGRVDFRMSARIRPGARPVEAAAGAKDAQPAAAAAAGRK
jgi:Tfp pilus assembly PilM family ATPase